MPDMRDARHAYAAIGWAGQPGPGDPGPGALEPGDP